MTAPLPTKIDDPLILYGESFASRLLLGTSRYPSPQILETAVQRARPAMITASLRRQGSATTEAHSSFWELLKKMAVPVLPNTAGCHRPQEVITTAQMAREEHLIKDGFKVLPYCTEDLILCQRLVDVGCQAVMPWAAPIGTGQGPLNPYALKLLRERLSVPLLVDAGLGLPSHACTVMEWGFDGVLLNTAVALAHDPVSMAHAFAQAVDAGRQAYLSGAMQAQDSAQASTPLVGTPFWHQDPGTNP